MMTPFTKMHGNGNDFVLLDNRSRSLALDAGRVRRMADRRFGIGFDQLLVLEPPSNGAIGASLASVSPPTALPHRFTSTPDMKPTDHAVTS